MESKISMKHLNYLLGVKMKKINFYGVGLNLIDTKEALNLCSQYFDGDNVNTIFFLNAHYYNLFCKEHKYRQALNESTLLLNDGIGISIGLKIKGIKEKENMNGTDFIPKVLELVEQEQKKVFCLGAKEEVIREVPKKLKEKYRNIDIVGIRNGYFNDEDKIIDKINNSGAEILIVGMGAPLQEVWVNENKHRFKNIKIIIAGGAIFDFISEKVTRAPNIIRKLRLEWLYRLYLEPRRLFSRYVIGNAVFFYNIFSNRKSCILGGINE